MKVMISGSGGMLATALIDDMLAQPSIEKIYALSSNPAAVFKRHHVDSRLEAVDFDRAAEVLSSEECDVLVHAAFPRQNDPGSITKGIEYTKRLLDLVLPSCAVLHISSQSVYDPSRTTPAIEDSNMENPSSPYGIAKLDSEQLVFDLCSGSKVSNIRLASLISPEFEDRFINKLIRNGLQTGEVPVFGSNNQFGFLDIADAADAITTMVLQSDSKDWQKVYNIGPHQKSYSLEEIASKVKEAIEKCGRPCSLSVSLKDQASSSGLDSTRFEQDFSWESQKTLDDTIKDIIDYQLVQIWDF